MEQEPTVPAPVPTSSTVPTRRVFPRAGVTFVAGTAAGGWSGYAVGAATTPVAADVALEPTGDEDLDELRRLAVKAPIEELIERRLVFLVCMTQDYGGDQTLWPGFDRLVDVALHGPEVPDRRLFARLLAQMIELGDPDFRTPRLPLAPLLRKVK